MEIFKLEFNGCRIELLEGAGLPKKSSVGAFVDLCDAGFETFIVGDSAEI